MNSPSAGRGNRHDGVDPVALTVFLFFFILATVTVMGFLAARWRKVGELVGIQAVLDVIGLAGSESASRFRKDLPLFVAFAVLAAFTYSSGLRAPALIAFVKDSLIYIVIIVAVIYLPTQLGGWSGIFDSAGKAFDTFNADNADTIASDSAAGTPA